MIQKHIDLLNIKSGLNSDVSKKEVNLQGQKLIVGATDIISLEASISNIDIGLIENEICDLKLDKYISKISVTTSKGTQQYSYNNAKLAKVEIKAKEIEGATVVIEYKIVITNEGELPTTVDKVIDYLPENMTFSSELNKSWGMQTKGQLVNTKTVNQRINAGESIELYLVLTKTMTGNSTGKVINIAEIGEISNSLGISDIDSTPANKTQGEDDYSQAEVIISVGTGGIVYVGIIIIIFVILVSILIVISKKGYIQAKYISKISKISIFIIIFSSLIWTGMDSVLSSSTDKITLAPSRLWFTWQSGSSHTNGYGSVCFWNSSKGWEAHCINAGWAAYNGWYNFSYATSLVNKVTDGTSPEITVNKVNYENGVDINTIGNYYMYGPLEFKATKKNSTEAINYDITAYDWEGQSKEVEVCDSEGSSKECKSEEAFYIKIPMNQITNGLAKITLTATLTGEKITTKTQSGYLVYSPPYGQNVKTTERHDVYELDTEQDVIVTDSVTWSTINVWLDVTKQDADNANIKLGNVEFYVKNGNGKYLQLLDENKDKLVCCTGEYEVDKYENMKWVVTQNDATTFKTENNGKFILKNLQGGIYYYIVEKDNPNYGYINDYTVTKAFNSNNKYGIIYVITLTNTKETGNLEIIKQDKEANRTLQGMSFKIKKTYVFKEDRADVNGEGGITISDVTDIQLYILYRIEFGMQPNGIGDVNNNGIINDKDIEYIQRHLLKQIEPFGLGDINTDGYINYEDKAYIEQYLIGGELSEEEKSRADINRDGYINDKDFKAIEQYLDVPGNARELSEEEKLRADVNQDKLIDQHDITIIDRYIETEKYNIQPHGIGDVNDDGVINTTDANLIQMRLAGYKTGICEYIIASDKNKTYTGEQKEVVGTISLTNMETTTNDNDATIFTTDENGKINILNMLKDDYYLEEISVGNNYYGYVVEDDYISYEYKGKTGNGNDIPFDISRQSSVETGASADSTVIKYSNILNVYNKQKYVKLSGYVWVDENSSKQSYRNDLYKTNEHPEIDGYEDDKDILKDGIKVRLKNKTTKELINETTTANGGKYLFIDVLIEELDNYYIEFEYDGLTYTNVVPHIDKDTGSKAAENATVRDDFNKNFSVIEGKSENTSITRDSYGNEKHTLTYNLDEKGYTATLINVEAEPIITSNTAEASYNIKDDFTYGQEEIENINLGLYERERPDIEILKDLYDVRVAVNGYTHIYEAGQAINHLTNNSNDAEAIFNAGIKFPSGKQTDYENISYRRAIYKADYECEVPGKELKVYATYVLKIRNTSTNLKVRVNEIMDYYHNAYTFEKIGTGINTKTRDLTGSVKKFTNDDNNKALSIELDTIISAQSMTEVYIQFSIPKDRLGDFLDEATDNGEKYKYVDNLENIAEINSYSVFDESGKIYAGIDKDSNPGNVDKEKLRKETRRKTEDDTSLAPGFRIEVRGTREIVGTVFLDESVFAENPNEIHTGETRNGNGIYDEAAERKISGVEVVLKNDNGEIAKIYDKETQKWKEAKANVDSNGNFSIKGFMPGEYMLTYKWGDNTYIVDNKSPINVKDYKGTIYLYPERAKEKDWYADEDNRYSDAMDNYETRKLIDAEDSTTNIMDSTTPTLGFGIEKGYSKEELLNKMGITEREGEIPTFTIPNVDFGITERARQLLDVEKTVDSVEILVGASTVAHGKLEKDDEGALKLSEDSSKYLTYIPPAGEQGNGMIKAEIDSELLHGAKAKIKYKISVVNNSEIDYDTKDYYLYGYPGQESEIINYKPIYVYDYLDKSLSYSEGGWNIQTLNGSGGIPGYNKTVGEKTVTEEYLHKNYLNLSDYSEEYVGYEDFKNKYKDAINNWTENNVNKAREKRLNGKTILQYNENIGIVNPGTESDDIGIIVEGELVNTQEIDLNNDVEITNVERQGETGRSIIPSSLYDRAESIVITSPTGENQNYILIIGVAISFLVTIGTGIVFIKKRVLR